MTPTPLQANMGWGFDNNMGYGGGFNNEFSATNKMSQY
jgi:hypothetical protein